jgi:hypothetical protein
MSGRGCAQLKRMLESQNVQEPSPQTGQTHIYKQPQRIEKLGINYCYCRADWTRRSNWPDADTTSGRVSHHHPMIVTCQVLNLVCSIVNVNLHLVALKWSIAPEISLFIVRLPILNVITPSMMSWSPKANPIYIFALSSIGFCLFSSPSRPLITLWSSPSSPWSSRLHHLAWDFIISCLHA